MSAGDPDPMVGSTLADRYRIDALVARGGMARVYRARDDRLDRDVAVKILSSPYADDPEFTARFLGEARAAASLSHPSLVHVYDSGSDGASHFIVMELLERYRTLRDILDERGRLPSEEVLRIGRELLAGLRVVHERGLVHCDVKAGNVMLGRGPAKLIDFGIARSPDVGSQGQTSIGSLQYMSPEQLHGRPLTPASDLFSLGVVLYEALTGRLPYPGRTPEEVSAAHAAGRVRPPSTLAEGVPGRLDEATLQALRERSESRFASAEAMIEGLDAAEEAAATQRDRDETTVLHPPARTPAATGGYVPPTAPREGGPPPSPRRRPAPPLQPPAPRSGAGGRIWALIGTLLVLGAAALVVVLVVVPLLNLGRGAADPSAGATVAPTPAATPGADLVVVPGTVGMSATEAIAAAQAANLDWTVRCDEDASQPEGIVDQEPPAGEQVPPGSAFTMYSARISDCR